ncbi:sensor histidine kinase [Aureimonas frigidaquae]|uniref:histidine kinase n=1 Tax=Aureimonas frigidaquae TaxID=424757 RepID=A0A0P0Z051_9HYPH|nr:PAS domain-containing sensor histidine kinase [Aureimonas frigidaquae]BAT27178.1 putative sensor histidine kinase [Aureimonas frigidaquae]
MQGQTQAGQLAANASPEMVLALALAALVLAGALLMAVWHIRQRARLLEEAERLRGELADAQSLAELRAGIIATAEQRVVAYAGRTAPEVLGQIPREYDAPREPAAFLSFRDWMPAYDAMALEREIDRLRAAAEPFRREVELANGRPLEVVGRTVGALAVVRFTPMSGMREELASLRIERQRTTATIETMQSLFDAAPMPMWLRARTNALVWVNTAFARSVEAESVDAAIDRQVEFFNAQDRAAIASAVGGKGAFRGGLTAVVEGDRRNFDVIEAAGPLGSAGLAVDVSAVEAVRRELKETLRSHSETLDHLTTAVARFDARTQLTYYNAEFQKLFDLSESYLDGKPDHVAIMDQLRTRGIMPEDRPLRDLKDEIMAAYRAARPTDALWHLADGRTLRVFASPEPQGGATWVFEDLTEKFQLESRLNALVRLQGETLDYLKEAVAVFGQDGRLRLSNPTFAEMWDFSREFLAAKPHIRAFAAATPYAIRDEAVSWGRFANSVTAFEEGARLTESGEFALDDGRMQSYGIVPLPNGQTMLTFSDVSVARQAERMLRERNEALEEADRIKNDFVQHVSYELRSPLTNIIGFSQLLRSFDTGPLNARQSEYLDYIITSTRALMTIVNDILDLASIDAGTLQLDLSDVDIARTLEQAVEAVEDKLQHNNIRIETDLAGAGTTMRADGKRVVQILFNLLSNAVNFTPAGGTVRLTVRQSGGVTEFAVADEGPGMAPDALARAFERFEQNAVGGRKSGAGLGLSIVKSFVELHQGEVEINSSQGSGTIVTCRFPAIEEA